MKTSCTSCRATYEIGGQFAGLSVRCPRCGQRFITADVARPPVPVDQTIVEEGAFAPTDFLAAGVVGMAVVAGAFGVLAGLWLFFGRAPTAMLIRRVALGTTGVMQLLFLGWEHRTYANLPHLRANRLQVRFSPGEVVAWWFCPLANLWKPPQAMLDILAGSDPDNLAGNFSRFSHSAVVACWWLAWLGSFTHWVILFRPGLSPELAMTGEVATLVALALTCLLVLRVSAFQNRRFNAMVMQDRNRARPA